MVENDSVNWTADCPKYLTMTQRRLAKSLSRVKGAENISFVTLLVVANRLKLFVIYDKDIPHWKAERYPVTFSIDDGCIRYL